MLVEGYRGLAKCRKLDVNQAVDDAIRYTLTAFDPHASWKPTEADCRDFGNLGVGLELRRDSKSGLPVVVTPIKDSPAYRAGIRAGDVITHITPLHDRAAINDIRDETKATRGAELAQVQRWLLGPLDSKVLLDIQREGVKEPLRLAMARGPVKIDTIHGWRRKDDDSWDYRLDSDKKIGYLRIVGFASSTPKELELALDELEGQGVSSVVLDLRFCEGGVFGKMIEAAELFLDKGTVVVKIQDPKGQVEEYACKDGKKRAKRKIVCLVNGDTCSAGEMFAAALQDHGRAVLVGERSRGVGSVRAMECLNDHHLCLTIAVFLRPNGKKLDRIRLPGHDADEWGVSPEAANVVQLEQKEQDALKENLDLRRIIPCRARVAKEPPPFVDRQLQQALKVLRGFE